MFLRRDVYVGTVTPTSADGVNLRSQRPLLVNTPSFLRSPRRNEVVYQYQSAACTTLNLLSRKRARFVVSVLPVILLPFQLTLLLVVCVGLHQPSYPLVPSIPPLRDSSVTSRDSPVTHNHCLDMANTNSSTCTPTHGQAHPWMQCRHHCPWSSHGPICGFQKPLEWVWKKTFVKNQMVVLVDFASRRPQNAAVAEKKGRTAVETETETETVWVL